MAKRVKMDPMVGAVVEAVEIARDLPEACKKMLATVIPQTLNVPECERHEYLTMFVDMVAEIVKNNEMEMRSVVDEARKGHEGKLASREGLKVQSKEADTHHVNVVEDMEAKKLALANCFRTVLEKRDALRGAQDAHALGEFPLLCVRKNMDLCKVALTEQMPSFRNAEDASALKELCDALISIAQTFELEEALVQSLRGRCERIATGNVQASPFDGMTLDQFCKELTAKQQEIAQTLQKGETEVLQLAAKVETAKVAHDKAVAELHCLAEVMNIALEAQKKSLEQSSSLQKSLDDFDVDVNKLVNDLEEKHRNLDNYITWNVASFEMLKAKAAKPVQEQISVESKLDASVEMQISEVEGTTDAPAPVACV